MAVEWSIFEKKGIIGTKILIVLYAWTLIAGASKLSFIVRFPDWDSLVALAFSVITALITNLERKYYSVINMYVNYERHNSLCRSSTTMKKL